LLATLALTLAFTGAGEAQGIEKKQVTLAVGGKTALYYLPLTICERLGYFKEQGSTSPSTISAAARSRCRRWSGVRRRRHRRLRAHHPHAGQGAGHQAVIELGGFPASCSVRRRKPRATDPRPISRA
jgi:hypothetical protein